MKAPLISAEGVRNEVELPAEIFDAQVNVPVMHEVVRAQLAAARAGTHSTKTRAEVRGGGKKPWRQKGTGRARHGSIREPQWVGGGVAHGPQPRDHSMRINKKVKALALRSALSDRAREGKVIVVELPEFAEPKTSKAIALLKTWEADGKILLVAGRSALESAESTWKSFRNLPSVMVVTAPNPYVVLAADTVVLTNSALTELTRPEAPTGFSDTPKPNGEPAPPEVSVGPSQATETEHSPAADGGAQPDDPARRTAAGAGEGPTEAGETRSL